MRAARSAAVRRGALGLAVVVAGALVAAAPPVAATVAPGRTQLVTRADDGPRPGSDAVETTLSGDGGHIAFSSREDYTGLKNNFSVNVYARDLATGATTQISVGHTPTEGDPVYDRSPDGESSQPSMSADGRYVAFVTSATDIAVHTGDIPNDSAPDVLVRDRDADGNGVLDDSTPVFHRITESWYYYGDPREPVLSADGTAIVWTDTDDGEGRRVVVRYRALSGGAPAGPIRIIEADTDPTDLLYPLDAYDGTISADGRTIAMTVDWVEYVEPGLRSRPLLRLGGRQSGYFPDFTAIMVVRLATEDAPETVTRADFDVDGAFLGTSREVGVRHPALSGDGAVLAFQAEEHTTDSDGAWYPTADQPTVYVSRIAEERSAIASLDAGGEPRNGAFPALSGDGRYLAFVTDSVGMHDGVDWGTGDDSCLHESFDLAAVPPPSEERAARTHCQVVVRDLVLDAARAAAGEPRLPAVLASPGLDRGCAEVLAPEDSCAGDDESGVSDSGSVLDYGDGGGVPVISADGSRVAFDSESETLTADDAFADDGEPYFEWDGFVRTFLPGLEADPVDFGTVAVGSAASRTATLRVEGAGPARVAAIAVEGADFAPGADTCTGVTLHRGGSCLAAVQFSPTAPGARTGVLVVRLSDGREFRVDLRGSGSPEPVDPEDPETPDDPVFSATPSPVDFGARLLLSTDPTAQVTVTNAGGSPMTVTSVAPASPGDYRVVSTDCAVVAPGASCAVVVEFRPTRPGPRIGVLRVDSDAPGGPHLVGLSGSGSTPALVVNPGVSKPGRVVSVSGTGFPADTEVTVGYRESVETATVLTSNEGAFSLSLLVFPKASIGQRTVLASVPGLAADVVEPGRLLVVYPSMSPPEFLTRG